MATATSRNRAIFILADVEASAKGAIARGGKLLPLDGVSTDSRTIDPGNLFVALSGESFDGHRFVAGAAAAGARAAVVCRGFEAPPDLPADFGLVEVDDPLRALGELALTHRRRFPELKLAAIGGSNGKTTTKELTAAVLEGAFGPTLRTEGNLNNEIGVPLTLLRLDASHKAAAVETGMNHPGELTRLARIAEPRAAIVTCAQAEHMEFFGTLEAVADAEGELYAALPAGAVAVVNLDDPRMPSRVGEKRRTLTYGAAPGAAVRLVRVVSHDRRGLAFEVSIHGAEPAFVRIPLIGVHNAHNACGALATGLALGGEPARLLEGLLRARGWARRLELKVAPGDVTVIDDCYNANPPSAVAALETARALAGEGRVLAALGDMLELGEHEESGHREVGRAAAAARLHALVAFGRRARWIAEAAGAAGLPEGAILRTEDPGEALRFLRERAGPGDIVLAKASRGTRLERVVDPLVGGEG